MRAYDRSNDHDTLLATWWAVLHMTQEFDTTFLSPLRPLGAFLAHWRSADITLVFAIDERGLWIAAWIEPLMSGACLGLWVRRDKRQSRAALHALYDVLGAAVATYPTVIAVTCQPTVRAQLTRLGFVDRGRFSGLWEGRDVHVCTLTQARWINERRRKEHKQFASQHVITDQQRLVDLGRELSQEPVCAG